jgi:hypothetical protein
MCTGRRSEFLFREYLLNVLEEQTKTDYYLLVIFWTMILWDDKITQIDNTCFNLRYIQ